LYSQKLIGYPEQPRAMSFYKSLALCAAIGLAACSAAHRREMLAQKGQIEPDATLQARTTVMIAAPAERVWEAIADIENWPTWQEGIRSVSISQRPDIKVPFAFSSGLWREHAQIVAFEPKHRLAWVGRVRTAHTIHVFTLSPTVEGITSVELSESVSGWPVGWFTNSTDLLAANQQWLVLLKHHVEHRRTSAESR